MKESENNKTFWNVDNFWQLWKSLYGLDPKLWWQKSIEKENIACDWILFFAFHAFMKSSN